MPNEKLKYVFLVQGEGRGHMTQAITLSAILEKAGHTVAHVFVGTNSQRIVPKSFLKRIKADNVELLPSPGFIIDNKSKGIRIWASIVCGLYNLRRYIKSSYEIHRIVKVIKPDVFLNFYDPLGGLYNFIFRPTLTNLCIGHQYLAHHQDFQFAPGSVDKWLFLLNNKLTSIGTKSQFALSFNPCKTPSNPTLQILPPLLRDDIKTYTSRDKNYILVYLLNKGYGEELMAWHKLNSEIKIHCFWDNEDYGDEYSPHNNLTFHCLNDQKFLEYMSGCKGYVSTAGFESICEAMYFGKPVMVVPVEGHYEQSCNALDALSAGAGIASDTFDLTKFMKFIHTYQSRKNEFHLWIANAEYQFLKALGVKKRTEVKKDRPLDQPRLTLPQHAH